MVEAIELEKEYAGVALFGRHRAPERGWRLGPLSLAVPRGHALAILGRNGSGKSTLLRLLAGTAVATRGRLRIDGRVARLLDLGAGFQEEWTGRQNARALLRLHGTPRKRLSRLVEAVADFAGLGDFVDAPVRTLSSGMRLRLAYAVAIADPPDVLIVDEVLAVGDEAFQRKCSLHIAEFLASGGTMVMATHNLYQAEKLCGQAIWLERGAVAATGACHDVAKSYRDAQATTKAALRGSVADSPHAASGGWKLEIESPLPGEVPGLRFGDRWVFLVGGPAPSELRFYGAEGDLVASISVPRAGRIVVPAGSILPGAYRATLVPPGGAGEPLVSRSFAVVGARRELGVALLPHQWL